jgi:hypothetical protein
MRGVTAARVYRVAVAILALGTLYSAPSRTDVLPDDRVDAFWSRYEGGGQQIDGKSWLIRKKVGDHLDLSYNHLIDVVSGASIDVRTSGASPYIEQRTQDTVSASYLYGKSTYSVGYTHSYEPDYTSNTAVFSISQDMFGDLTTVTMSYRRTWNDVFRMTCMTHNSQNECEDKVHDPAFGKKDMDERSYGVGLTQILTRNSILAVNFEVITDQGWLSNPYREIRYKDPTSGSGYSLAPEVDPNTRTSNALGMDYKYYLPYRASLDGQYRYFQDTWAIRAHTFQLGYTQPWRNFTFDASVRYYMQTGASFYSDLFDYANQQNFMSRNRELSTFHSYSLGGGVSYEFKIPQLRWLQRSTANLRYDHMTINYEDYRDATLNGTNGYTAGTEPLYTLQVNIFQLFFSIFF